jgi:predicted RND superfamily exporter protein
MAIAGATFGIQAGLKMDFDYDVLALLPKDSMAAEYQRRMVSETDYQSEIVIFTAKSMEEIRRITEAAQKLPAISKVQSISQFFPEDGDERITEAQKIGGIASSPLLKKNINSLAEHGLDSKSFDLLRGLLQSGSEKLEDYEEQAFSSGNRSLVEALEALKSDIDHIVSQFDKDPSGSRIRSEALFRSLLKLSLSGLDNLSTWKTAKSITPTDLPPGVRERFVAADGTLAAYGYPLKSVYDPENLDELMKEVYSVSPEATGFPSTHQVFSKAVVSSFSQGTKAAILVCLAWLIFVIRKPKGIVMAALPLVIGGGWMLGTMKLVGLHYNYANIIALPLVIALAVDYGVWLSHRWMAMEGAEPFEVAKDAGRVILLAAGTELAGLGAITLASYRGVSGLGVDITIGLLTCLVSTLFIAPVIGLILTQTRKP